MELFKLFGTIAINNDEANQNIDETTNLAEKSESKMSAAFKKIGGAIATYFAVDKIQEFGKEIVNVAAEVSAESSAFEQIMGDYSDQASEKVGKIAEATGMVSTRLTPYMTSMTAKFKGLGYDIDDATNLASDGLNIAADAAAFWDKSLDDSMSALNSFINGSYEGGEAIGLFANDTQLASYAVKNGIVSETKEWANLDEAKKQATRLEYAQSMFAMSGATGQAAKEADQYANVQANLNEKWRQFKAQIGEPLLENVVLPAMQKLSDLVDKLSPAFERLQQWVSENAETLKVLAGVIAVGTAALIAYKGVMMAMSIVKAVTTALNGMTIAQYALNLAMSLNPIGLIVAAIAALVAAFVILWNKSEGFRNFWIGLWDGIKNAVGAVVDWIKENWQTMLLFLVNPLAGIFKYCYEHFEGFRNFVDNVITAVKGFFVGLWEKIVEVFTSIVDWINGAIESIKGFFVGLWNSIVEIFTSIVEWIRVNILEPIAAFYEKWIAPVVNKIIEIVTKLVEIVIALFVGLWNLLKQNVIDPIVEAFRWLWEQVSGFFVSLWNDVVAFWTTVSTWFDENVIQPVVEFFRGLWETVSGFFTSLWDDIVGIWNTVSSWFDENVVQPVAEFFAWLWEGIVGDVKNTWNTIKNTFASVGSWFNGVFQSAYNAVTGVFSKIGSFFGTIWGKIKDTFSKLGTTISDAIGGAVKAGINGIIGFIERTINNAIGLINGAIGLINKLPGVNIKKIGELKMPRLAKGGIVDKPTIAQVGESGKEAIVPLEKNTGWIDRVADRLNASHGNDSTANENIIQKLDELIETIKKLKVYLDSGVLVGELAPAIDVELGNINRLRVRGQ